MHTNAKKSLQRIERHIRMPMREFLLEHYDHDQLSFREISQELKGKGISVSHCTLYRWYAQLCGCPRSKEEAIKNWWT